MTKKTGLELLREPFEACDIGKLPKPNKTQTELVKSNYKNGIRCKICGQWHHPDVEHLDYVGHAAITKRLIECDPQWSWKPLSLDEKGLPCLDKIGGLWIELTVCGAKMLGYGHSGTKQGGDAVKELIGDALRNAAMRFGAALNLWHKGEWEEYRIESEPFEDKNPPRKPEPPKQIEAPKKKIDSDKSAKNAMEWSEKFKLRLKECSDFEGLTKTWDNEAKALDRLHGKYPDLMEDLTETYNRTADGFKNDN